MKFTSIASFLVIISLGSFCLSSCRVDIPDLMIPVPEGLDTVLGLSLFDANGNPIGNWRTPNDRQGEVVCFPVPSNGALSIVATEGLTDPNKTITKVWVRKGTCCLEEKVLLDEETTEVLYTIDRVSASAELELDIGEQSQFQLDLSALETGFYKVFYTLKDNSLFWQNIYLDPSRTNFESFDFLDQECN